tara:strand:- start:5587 stop:6588 length:1002 start_codon:yes stop_codon:yes gene_type:complete
MYDIISQQSFYLTLATLTSFCIIFAAILSTFSVRFKLDSKPIVEKIDSLLPQTQCGQCSYPGCKPYAQAMANGDAINKCPPGGQKTINAIASLLDINTPMLDSQYGKENDIKLAAYIREDECIGCTKCIQACPVDAILGAAKLMHTVIENECTGCDLCVDPCPVDCIDMLPVKNSLHGWKWDQPSLVLGADKARIRFEYQKNRKEEELLAKKTLRDSRLNKITKKTKAYSSAEEIIRAAMGSAGTKKSSPEKEQARFLRRIARAEDQLRSAQNRLDKLKLAIPDDKHEQAVAAIEDAHVRLNIVRSSHPIELKVLQTTKAQAKIQSTQKKIRR